MVSVDPEYYQRFQRSAMLLGFLNAFVASIGLPVTISLLLLLPLMIAFAVHISKMFWKDRGLLASSPYFIIGFFAGTFVGHGIRLSLHYLA
ncbi:hypothetical protein SAMN02745181_0456 [Rubritalea squalenifaciens DSM 18772]|uniref:Uncharacterized protein n=1 Tax=Rubritalea squalenifaciens DSM 18772 TaxID=1123071 RepID=A0A1M6CDY4_9BACT|nr:hypothetical protein SAMN02745181_0456 [Rubritalea squalenifaciens DSM 18772]